MPYFLVTADTDLTAKSKRLASWHFSNSVAAAVINLRNGSVTGDIVAQIRLAIDTSASQAYALPRGLEFPAGLFVDVVTGTVVGSVDLI
jgi:hypothetical protein